MPGLSIVIPVYNAEKFLKRTMDAVSNQIYQDWELIFVDDGSTDLSLRLCQVFAKKDPRVHVITQENAGPGIARNKGIEFATGRFIAFMDSDDYILPEMYSTMMNAALTHDADVVKCDFVQMPEALLPVPYPVKKSDILDKFLTHRFQEGMVDTREFLKKLTSGYRDSSACVLLIKAELCSSMRFNNKFYEDAFFNLDLAQKAERFYYLPDAFYIWLRRDNSRTGALTLADFIDMTEYNLELYSVCDEFGDMEEEKPKLMPVLAYLTQIVEKTIKRNDLEGKLGGSELGILNSALLLLKENT